jgi:hypothetical protein
MDQNLPHLSSTYKELRINVLFVKVKGKCKAILLQAWTGPEGSRRLRLPDLKTIGK